MPLPGDLIHQTSSTAGTGAQTLVAVLGRRSFLSWFGTGGTNTFDYYISHRTAAEHERGTGHESGGTLVRDTVLANHLGTTALVNFSAGVKDIFNDVPANQQVVKDLAQTLYNKDLQSSTAATPTVDDDDTSIATTAHVKDYAAPFPALADNDIIINGWCDHSQEIGGGLTPNWINYNGYFLDQWRTDIGIATPGSSNFQVGQVATGLYNIIAYCLQTQIYGAGNSFAGANDYAVLYQPIEGTRFSILGWGYSIPTPVTLGFWVMASATGTFTVILAGVAKAYAHNFTVNAVNTWEYKTFTFPGDTTGGNVDWPTNTGVGAYLQFCFGAGSSQKVVTPDTWAAWVKNATASQSNFFATVNNSVYITGVSLMPGSIAPSSVQSILMKRSVAVELALCQRYWQKIMVTLRWNSQAAESAAYPLSFPVMRSTPTITLAAAGARGNIGSVTYSGDYYQSGTIWPVSAAAGDSYIFSEFLRLNARL